MSTVVVILYYSLFVTLGCLLFYFLGGNSVIVDNIGVVNLIIFIAIFCLAICTLVADKILICLDFKQKDTIEK